MCIRDRHRCIRDEPGWGQKQGRGSFKKGTERTHRSRKWGKGWLGSKARFVKGGGDPRRSRQRSVVGTCAQNCELTASVDRMYFGDIYFVPRNDDRLVDLELDPISFPSTINAHGVQLYTACKR